MEEILHQLIGSLSHHLQCFFYKSQVVQDFFHQQNHLREEESQVFCFPLVAHTVLVKYFNSGGGPHPDTMVMFTSWHRENGKPLL